MIDIDNYKRAIRWLRRGLAELDRQPGDPTVQASVLQSFEVTQNLSESALRQAYVSLGKDREATYLSVRELIWRASEEGIVFPSCKQWLEYGLALESMREAMMLSLPQSIENAPQLLSRFAQDLESFAHCLEKRLATNA